MKDVYLMNKETGELVESEKVFKEFYKTHGIKESVFTEWEETNIEADNEIGAPMQSFIEAVRI